MHVHQTSAFQRHAATKKSIESEEMAQARAYAERIDLTVEDDQSTGGVDAEPLTGLRKTQLDNCWKLLREKAKALKAWIKEETTEIIARMMTAWGVPASAETPCEVKLDGYAQEARDDVERHREACIHMLALWDDEVITPIATALEGAQSKKVGANIAD